MTLRSEYAATAGGEFVNDKLDDYLAAQNIVKTTTTVHDPSGNASAENAVGKLKRLSYRLK